MGGSSQYCGGRHTTTADTRAVIYIHVDLWGNASNVKRWSFTCVFYKRGGRLYIDSTAGTGVLFGGVCGE